MKFREIILRKEKKEEVKFKPASVVSKEEKEEVAFTPEVVYKNTVGWVDSLFSKIDARESVTESPEENVKLFIDMLSSDKPKVIRMACTPPDPSRFGTGREGSYVPMHSVNVCILSLATGQEMRLPYKELMKIGTASLVHCVGRHPAINKVKINIDFQ